MRGRGALALLTLALLTAALASPLAAVADDSLGGYTIDGQGRPAVWTLLAEWKVEAGMSARYAGLVREMGAVAHPYDKAYMGWSGGSNVEIVRLTPDHKWAKRDKLIFSSGADFEERIRKLYHPPGWGGASRTSGGNLEKITYSGRPAFKIEEEWREDDDVNMRTHQWRRYTYIWVPYQAAGGDLVFAEVAIGWEGGEDGLPPKDREYAQLIDETDKVLASIKLEPEPGGATPGSTSGGGAEAPGDEGGLPWRTAGSGALAVAAAAVGIAGTAAKTRAKGKQKLDKTQVVGYVLQLSSRRLYVTSKKTARLQVDVWEVLADGNYRPSSADIALELPSGVAATATQGNRTLTTDVWQTGPAEPRVTMTVRATAGAGSTAQTIELLTESDDRVKLELDPSGKELSPDGKDVVKVTATIVLSPASQADPAIDAAAAEASIEFSSASAWVDRSAAVPVPNGKAINVQISQPDPVNPQAAPESVSVGVTARIGDREITEAISIPVAGTPVLDAEPDRAEFVAELGESAEVHVWIESGGSTGWRYSAAWADGDVALARFEFSESEGISTTLTIAEDSKGKLPLDQPVVTSTLRVFADSETARLERHVKVAVLQEGLFVDSTGRHGDGTFHISADGESAPTDIDVRVYARDAEGRIALDEQAAFAVEFSPASAEGTAGAAALAHDDLTHTSAGIRESNVNAAIHRFTYPRLLPTDGTPVPATLEASVPGFDKPAFTKQVSIGLVGPATAPYTDSWFKERDACLKVIYDFVPGEAQPKFVRIVMERGTTMGAEGLYEMRKRFWEYARNSLMAQHEDYMYTSWKWEQAEGLADWVSWCCDIAVGVATGSLVGTSAIVALGLIKPSLVSAMDVWTKGGSIDDWARGQFSVAAGVVEGAATDIDLLKRIPGGAPAAWTVFICYWFVRELMRDPEMSVKNAMVNVARMVRDQALTTFLRGVFGTKPGTHVADETPYTPPKKPDTARPGTWKPGGADAPPPRPPKGRTPAGGKPTSPPKPSAGAPEAPAVPPVRPPADAGQAPPVRAPKPSPGGEPAAAPPKKPQAEPQAKPPAPPKPDAPETKPPAGKKPDAPDAPPKTPGKEKPPTGKTPDAPEKPAPKAPPKPGKTMGGPAASKLVREHITMKDGKPHVDRETMSKIMRDPDAAREMRRTDPEAYQAYENTRAEVRAAHDKQLVQTVKDRVPGLKGKNVRVETVGTEGGIDRDYHVQVEVPDPRNPGKTMWIEVPKEQWQGDSQRIFAEQTGGPKDPAEQAKWAHDHQQVGGDSYIGEAAIDMAGEATVKGPDGNPVRVQVEPRDRQVMNVKPGHTGEPVKLIDPDGYGKTWETKVAESTKGGQLDGYAQAKKAVDTLDKVRQGYENQNMKVGDLSPDVEKGARTVRLVAEGKLSVEEGNAALRNMNLGDLPTFMGKVSAQFGALKWAK